MAADDITLATFHFEGPTAASSFGIHYQETTAHDASTHSTQALAEALDAVLSTPIKSALSDDWSFASIVVRLLNVTVEPKWRHDINAGDGLRVGPALPANQTWLIKQSQLLFPPKSNGRIFFPGLAEGDTTIGVLTNAFITGPAVVLTAAMQAPVAQLSAGTGIWTPGVISRKVLDAAPPAKDWAGAFSEIGVMNPWSIIAHQRRRRSKVVGAKQ